MSKGPHKRRSLSYVGGAIKTLGGDESKDLAHALDVTPETDLSVDQAHVHGFHTYPARLHPITASRLVQSFSSPGNRILDPFCGSGTILIESLLLGREVFGVDLNPLAVLLTKCKIRARNQEELDHMIAVARECAAYADQQRMAKSGARQRFPNEDMQLFEPHVLLELDSLRSKITSIKDDRTRQDLLLVLSSILVKLSRKSGDTSSQTRIRRTMPGFASRIFVQKTEELTRRIIAFQSRLPEPNHSPMCVEQGDAKGLEKLLSGKVDAIVTSPPYAATYDYVAHHQLRLRWLQLDAGGFRSREMGARSRYQKIDPLNARMEWSKELSQFFRSAGRVLKKDRPLVLIMADSAVGNIALRAEEIVSEIARDCGFIPVACASQEREHFHGATRQAFQDRPRREHAILMRRS